MEEPQLDVPNESHFNVHQQSPSSSLLLSPLPDDWVEEITIDVPDETPMNSAPDGVMNATENSNVAGHNVEAVVPGTPSRPLQVDCDDGRLRQQVLANIQQHLIVINPTNETRSNATLTQTENEFATCINDQRRLCDCLSCVSHALRHGDSYLRDGDAVHARGPFRDAAGPQATASHQRAEDTTGTLLRQTPRTISGGMRLRHVRLP